ncbi:dTMP kinase [Comamonas thiooxydans]|uniref:Thymidylate kinase n=1 Tax=Comamonas thiooxydans TaxID=363952 RepID=A0A0E3BT00_9BURK|nr:dTMP kinase [Comamonas thiooxydans]KGH10116.1 thymidylate kinase [Comamonas thiooxydans]KGH17515.1 thymidylate kinase [Comamonas thiooxydans]KGH22134.1 thymidylate kinase [Comamonas thiooxydans]
MSTALPKGLFISFEGIDGAGKSSHIEALAQAFRDQGRAVTLTREPGGTPLAEKLRALMLHDAMDPLTEALIAFAARRDHLVQVIEPALARGEVVISDRFTDATFAYQGAGRGFSWEQLSVLERMAQTGTALQAGPSPDFMREPDMTLWFDLPAEVAAERLATARVPDRFEAQPGEFFARVTQGYAERARTAPQRFVRIDAHASRHAVWQQITQAVVRKGWLAIMVGSKP